MKYIKNMYFSTAYIRNKISVYKKQNKQKDLTERIKITNFSWSVL